MDNQFDYEAQKQLTARKFSFSSLATYLGMNNDEDENKTHNIKTLPITTNTDNSSSKYELNSVVVDNQ